LARELDDYLTTLMAACNKTGTEEEVEEEETVTQFWARNEQVLFVFFHKPPNFPNINTNFIFQKLPVLARLARALLAIPATCATVNCVLVIFVWSFCYS
jgi:hypothetical protein